MSDQKRADNKAHEILAASGLRDGAPGQTGDLPARVQLHFIDTGVIGSAGPDEARIEKARQKLATAAEGIRAGTFAHPDTNRLRLLPFREVCPASAA